MNSPLVNNITNLQTILETINSLPEAGVELPELSNEGVASDLLSGKQLINSEGEVVTGTIATKTGSNLSASGATVTVPAGYYASQATKSVATATQATPSVSINSSGLITASATQTAGYVSAGTKSGTKQLTTQAAKTITPTKSSQTAVASGRYTTGTITVAAIPSQYITTTDATAEADEIMSGETAYVNGAKVTGTFTIDEELTAQDNLITQIQTALQSKASAPSAEDLEAELSEQEALISQLSDILDNKASGSGGNEPEVCTLTTGTYNNYGEDIIIVEYKDGEVNCKYTPLSAGTNQLVSDCVLRGSMLFTYSTPYKESNLTKLYGLLGYANIYKVEGDATIDFYTCLAYDTPILLINGESKKIQDITYNDNLLVWDFDNGCFASAKPLWIKKPQKATYYYHCIFKNGATLKLIGSNEKCHRLFNMDKGCFLSATDCVDNTVITKDGPTKLVSCQRVDEEIEFYNIITDYHINLYANGILTSCRLNNLYEIKNMKFIKEKREDIPIHSYNNIDESFYHGLRLDEQKLENIEWINEYVQRLQQLMLLKEA